MGEWYHIIFINLPNNKKNAPDLKRPRDYNPQVTKVSLHEQNLQRNLTKNKINNLHMVSYSSL